MNLRTAIVAACVVPLFFAGCEKKKTKEPFALAKLPDLAYPVVLPPAVTSTTPPQPTMSVPAEPKSLPQPVRTKPKPRPQRPAATAEKGPNQHSGSSTSSASGSSHVGINSGPDTNSSISAGLPHTDETHHRETTSELIQQTEDNLRLLTRQLSTDEQNQVEQIRNFLDQARSATSDNDLVRAHNLALKAHLLSDELLRR
jgi:hypothetical protein